MKGLLSLMFLGGKYVPFHSIHVSVTVCQGIDAIYDNIIAQGNALQAY